MRAVCFDLDGTLLHLTRPYREILADAFRDVGAAPSPGAIDRYNEAFFDGFRSFAPEPVVRAVEATDVPVDADAFAEALLDREIEATRPPEGTVTDLKRLSSRFRLGVVTNGVPDWQAAKLRAHDLDSHVDAVVASYEAGAHKPDPAPFELAEERLPAEGYAMVGDADADVQGATGVGWTAYRYAVEGFGGLPGALDWEP